MLCAVHGPGKAWEKRNTCRPLQPKCPPRAALRKKNFSTGGYYCRVVNLSWENPTSVLPLAIYSNFGPATGEEDSCRDSTAVSNCSLARFRHLKYWIRDVFGARDCQTPPLQLCVYCDVPCYCTPRAATATARTHARTHARGRVERQFLLAGSLQRSSPLCLGCWRSAAFPLSPHSDEDPPPCLYMAVVSNDLWLGQQIKRN